MTPQKLLSVGEYPHAGMFVFRDVGELVQCLRFVRKGAAEIEISRCDGFGKDLLNRIDS